MMPASAWLLAIALALPVWAGSPYIESPPVSSLTEATSIVSAVQELGYSGSVIRRNRPQGNYTYVVVVDSPGGPKEAQAMATALTRGTGLIMSVVTENATQRPDHSHALPSATEVLQQASQAHGGGQSPLQAMRQASTVLFRYRRYADDGSVVRHTFARRGSDWYLDIQIEQGTGVSGQFRIVGGNAVLLTNGRSVTRDPGLTRLAINRFAPDAVLPFMLDASRLLVTDPNFQGMYRVGVVTEQGQPREVLRRGAGRLANRVEVAIDPQSNTIRRILLTDETGTIERHFSDYANFSGYPMPSKITVQRGDHPIQEIQLLEFDLINPPPSKWFKLPKP